MADEWQNKKNDLTSTAIEKGIDLAKEFLDKLLMPAVETTGLLISERISLFRFNNQVNVQSARKMRSCGHFAEVNFFQTFVPTSGGS